MTEQSIEFPFEHPAAKQAKQLFLTLKVYSDDDYRRLARRDRYLWDIEWFEAEIMNGGMDQYFSNSAGDHIAECLEALDAIGARLSYQLLKKACSLFPAGRPSPTREIRQKQLRDVSGEKYLDDLIQGRIELDLYRRMMDYYQNADPAGA
jgi:hypothetical protein